MVTARFRFEGVDVEVEPMPGPETSWRARVVWTPDRDVEGPWFTGRYAWQAMESAARQHRARF
jgi:hypothetical protein